MLPSAKSNRADGRRSSSERCCRGSITQLHHGCILHGIQASKVEALLGRLGDPWEHTWKNRRVHSLKLAYSSPLKIRPGPRRQGSSSKPSIFRFYVSLQGGYIVVTGNHWNHDLTLTSIYQWFKESTCPIAIISCGNTTHEKLKIETVLPGNQFILLQIGWWNLLGDFGDYRALHPFPVSSCTMNGQTTYKPSDNTWIKITFSEIIAFGPFGSTSSKGIAMFLLLHLLLLESQEDSL